MNEQSLKTMDINQHLPALIGSFFSQLREIHKGALAPELNLHRREFERLINAKSFNCEKLDTVLQKLNMSVDSFYYHDPDPFLASLHLKGVGDCRLPKKYFTAAYSKRRVGRIIFAILDKYFSPDITQSLKRIMQIDPTAFNIEYDNERVSTELYGTIYSLLKNVFGFSNKHLYWIGQKTFEFHAESELGKTFFNQSRENAYQIFLEEVSKHVEKSYNYELFKCDKDEVIIRKRLSPEIAEKLGKKTYGNEETDYYSIGFTTTIGYFSSTCFPHAKKTACLYENNQYSEYCIDLKRQDDPPLMGDQLSLSL